LFCRRLMYIVFFYKVFYKFTSLSCVIFVSLLLLFDRKKYFDTLNCHIRGVQSAHTSRGSSSFESSAYWIILISVYMRIASAIVISSIDVNAEKIYIHLERYSEILLFVFRISVLFYAHALRSFRAQAYMHTCMYICICISFDFHKFLPTT